MFRACSILIGRGSFKTAQIAFGARRTLNTMSKKIADMKKELRVNKTYQTSSQNNASPTIIADPVDALAMETEPKSLPIKPLHHPQLVLEKIGIFSDCLKGEWMRLFEQKIEQCCYICDFSCQSTTSHSSEYMALSIQNIDLKSISLRELLFFVSSQDNQTFSALKESHYIAMIEMFSRNIFRTLPPRHRAISTIESFDLEEDEPVYDARWPHFRLLYEVLIRFIENSSFSATLAKSSIDQRFVGQLLNLFDSQDPRERELVKTLVHRIYGKILHIRSFIRFSFRFTFHAYMSTTNERHHISEILEILGSIINGFAVPLRQEHLLFLEKTLIPLHKHPSMPLYWPQLSLCIFQFGEKDSSLVPLIIKGMLRIWPRTNSNKEIMFLNEIEELIDMCPEDQFANIMVPLSQRIADCIKSYHFQVAERGLYMINGNEYFMGLIAKHSKEILPILLPALLEHSHDHWNRNVQLQIFAALKSFMEIDSILYEQISAQPIVQDSHHLSKWKDVEEIASRQLARTPVQAPFSSFPPTTTTTDSSSRKENISHR